MSYPQEIILLGGHTVIVIKEDDCPECGEEMQDIVFYGVVCTNPDCKVNNKNYDCSNL